MGGRKENVNIYEKLQYMRVKLQNTELKKSGRNTYSGYSYFELTDFLPAINKLMLDSKVTSSISYGTELATLKLINTENPEEVIEFTSPMSTANLKGCHEVQNLGAVETYLRRYLYMTAFEICESEILDKVHVKSEEVKKRAEKAEKEFEEKQTEFKPKVYKEA